MVFLIYFIQQRLYYYSFTSAVATDSVSTAGISSATSSTGANSSFKIISLFSILAPISSLVLADFPTLSLK